RSCGGRVQGEAPDEAEGVEHACAGGEPRDERVVDLLVEVETGLVAGLEVGFETELVDADREGPLLVVGKLAGEQTGLVGESLEAAGAHVVALEDRAGVQ